MIILSYTNTVGEKKCVSFYSGYFTEMVNTLSVVFKGIMSSEESSSMTVVSSVFCVVLRIIRTLFLTRNAAGCCF